MTEEDDFNSEVSEIREIFTFLTEEKPSPDDEIDAREQLIEHFSKLSHLSVFPEYNDLIKSILQKLEDWDTLDLWFLETSIPDDIRELLNIPKSPQKPSKEEVGEIIDVGPKQVTEKKEIDLTQIVDKVSEQFKGEIEGLKGKIEELKKELEEKDETLKSLSQKKKVQKIILQKEPKLPLPKIKIPVIKKPTIQPESKITPKETEVKPVMLEPIEIKKESVKKDLIPIPIESADEFNELSPIPEIEKDEAPVIKELEEIPIITEKRKITPIVIEESVKESVEEEETEEPHSMIFSVEKPKIKSMKIEEIETGAIKSSSMDLFNVFSSVGEKTSESKEKKVELKAPKRPTEEKNEENPPIASFVNFNQSKSPINQELTIIADEELPTDKDSLYQELIALEGKRYAL
ncbi:MAG: hypothetical protein ACFE8E_14525, partial [Candidatus Hodarchaeota archaeon]